MDHVYDPAFDAIEFAEMLMEQERELPQANWTQTRMQSESAERSES